MRAATLKDVYGGYEESEDEQRGEKEGISTTGVPFLDVPRWKLDDGGWRWEDGLIVSLRVGSGALQHRGGSGNGGRTSLLRFLVSDTSSGLMPPPILPYFSYIAAWSTWVASQRT
jgi:hypothetical protein